MMMRTDSGTTKDNIYMYSSTMFFSRECSTNNLWQTSSREHGTITRFEKVVDFAFLHKFFPLFINYTVLCTYNLPQNAILYFLLHFGGPILAMLACLALKIPFRAAYQSNHSKAGARGDF